MTSGGWALSKCAVALLLAPLPLAVSDAVGAQERGAFEIGVGARFTRFDDNIRLDPALGAGARLALLVGHDLSLELSAAYSESDADGPPGTLRGSYLPVALRLVRRDSLSPRMQFLYGGGLVRNHYGLDLDTYEYGGSALVGLRWLLTQWLALRPEGVMDFMLSPSSGSTADFTFALQLGATVQLGRVPPSDRDFDGVADLRDLCPLTRRGVAVGDTGCPLEADEDVDGVPDMRDRCPGTPVTAVVDAQGCPRFPDTTRVTPPARPPPPTSGPDRSARRTALIAPPPGHSYIRAFRRPARSRRARLLPTAHAVGPTGEMPAPTPSARSADRPIVVW